MSGEVQPAEVVLARLRPHGRALFWPCVALILVAFGAGYSYGRFPEPWENDAIVGAALVLAVVLWMAPLLRWLSRNYTITTRRVIVRGGIMSRSRQEASFARSFDVTVHRSGLQALFGSGDVVVRGGADSAVVLRDVPRPGLAQAAISELIEQAAPRRFGDSAAPHFGEYGDDGTVSWRTR